MKRVMVADDNPIALELAQAALKSLGCEFRTAADGIEALNQIRQWLPDLVLLDLRMPGLDGFEVVDELRRDAVTAALCLVAFTASGMNGDREKALAYGFDGYITKPISIAELRKEVTAWLSRAGNP